MKKVFIFLSVCMLAFSVSADDWRTGRYMNPVPEYLLSVNLDGKMMMGKNADLNPWGYGFSVEYLYKTGRKRNMVVSTAHGFGGKIGMSYFRGTDIPKDAVGSNNPVIFDQYKSFNYVPIMLSYNLFITHKRSHYILGVDAGINLMIRERDYADSTITYFNGENEIKLTRVLPSFSAYFGYMYELSPNLRLKGKVGMDYTMGYVFDGRTPTYTIAPITGQIIYGSKDRDYTTSGLLNLSASFGLVYSL
ncbi:MAG: hypothetical protein H6Q15_453 [Bacteroidetes bacterium]|nr:hypothetical protein [Bacteroidota bacterium]